MVSDFVADICFGGILEKGRDNLIPSFRNWNSNQSEYGSEEIVETYVVIVDKLIFLNIFEQFQSDRCIKEQECYYKFDDFPAFRKNINNWAQICFSPWKL